MTTRPVLTLLSIAFVSLSACDAAEQAGMETGEPETETVEAALGGAPQDLGKDHLKSGWRLSNATSQQFLSSGVGRLRYQLIMQNDCNLVLYRYDNSLNTRRATWSTGTHKPTLFRAGLLACEAKLVEGNFVVERQYRDSRMVAWETRTSGNADPALILQNDGNLVLIAHTGTGYKKVWESGTAETPLMLPGDGRSGAPGHPGCTYSRRESDCKGIGPAALLLCRNVYVCGFDQQFRVKEETHDWFFCGYCVNFDF